MPNLSFYLTDYQVGCYINSSEPVSCSFLDILDTFDGLSRTEGSFIGVVRDNNESLQFIWSDPENLRADIPVMALGGSLVRRDSVQELRKLIDAFASGVDIWDFPGFQFERF